MKERMKPEDAVRAILQARGDAIAVPTMCALTAWNRFAPGDEYTVGCVGFMGGASSIALGLALGLPERKVLALDGDGSLLMQLGSLASVAGAAPSNYVHFVFANNAYQTSGSQETPGGEAISFATMARGAGYAAVFEFDDLETFRTQLPAILQARGPVMVELHTGEAELSPMMPDAPNAGPFAQQVARLRERLASERGQKG